MKFKKTDYQLIVVKCNSSNRPSPFTEFRALPNTDYHSFNIQSCQSNLRIIFNAKLIAVKGLVFGNWKFLFFGKKKKYRKETISHFIVCGA